MVDMPREKDFDDDSFTTMYNLDEIKRSSPLSFSLTGSAFSSDVPTPSDTSAPPSEIAAADASVGVAGTAPDEVYAKILSPWRAAARRFVIRNLRNESELLAKMQVVRRPWLDSYFVYTSSLGTHTFFMSALPALFFFGYADAGRGLIFVLAMGVYLSSFIKDFICAPRPYSPPVTRLTIGSHHLEYGFPSTHSTNSISIALFIYSQVHVQYFTVESISTFTYALACLILSVYAFSIVYGRLYTGMHSLTDCAAGILLGTTIWAAYAKWWAPIEDWLVSVPGSPYVSTWLPHWVGPLLITTLCLLIVHWHPQPAEDCPCFEDAIAFVSVVAGVTVSRWGAMRAGFEDSHIVTRMPGSPLPFLESDAWAHSDAWLSAWRAASMWWGVAFLKLVLGITLIFVWRLVAKFLLHLILPPIFRTLSNKILPRLVLMSVLPKGSELPIRRFYTPATDYDGSVPEGGLRPIPSVIDLPSALQERGGMFERDGEMGHSHIKRRRGKEVKRDGRRRLEKRAGFGEKVEKSEYLAPMGAPNGQIYGSSPSRNNDDELSEDGEIVKHYDADVLTKVFVYAGIGALASTVLPIMFEVLGWGIHP